MNKTIIIAITKIRPINCPITVPTFAVGLTPWLGGVIVISSAKALVAKDKNPKPEINEAAFFISI